MNSSEQIHDDELPRDEPLAKKSALIAQKTIGTTKAAVE